MRLWRVLKPRLVADRMTDGLRDAGAAAGLRAGADGAPRHLDRPPGAVAAVGRFRPDRRARRSRNPGDRRRARQCRQPQADRRYPVRQDGTARRHQDQDRRVVDHRAGARRPRRAGPRLPAEDSGMAPGLKAEIDLYRRAAGLRQSADPPRAHDLRAGGDHHGAPVVERAESAEHPGAHRGRPQDPPRLHRDAGPQAGLGRLFADRAAPARRDRRRAGRCGRRSATGSTFTP